MLIVYLGSHYSESNCLAIVKFYVQLAHDALKNRYQPVYSSCYYSKIILRVVHRLIGLSEIRLRIQFSWSTFAGRGAGAAKRDVHLFTLQFR